MSETTERELRAAILESPDDHVTRMVYADWLLEQGNLRGELIALQCAQPTEDEGGELRRRALWQHCGARWLAEDLGSSGIDPRRVEYRAGFIYSVQVPAAELVGAVGPVLAQHPIHTLRLGARAHELAAVADSPVLRTVRRLELVTTFDDEEALARLFAAPALSRLEGLSLNLRAMSNGTDAMWPALERCPRLAELTHLALSSVDVSVERARWLGRALPALRELRCTSSLDAAALPALAESATFRLQQFRVRNQSGPEIGDATVAAVLDAPMLRTLETLSLARCGLGAATAARLPTLPATLTELDLGEQRDPEVALALDGCTFPALRSLNIADNELGDAQLPALRRFPELTSLRAGANRLTARSATMIVDGAPGLHVLSLDDTTIGDDGVCTLASAPSSTALRSLHLYGVGSDVAAVQAIRNGGRLTELRELVISGRNIGLHTLADGPFDKIARLEVRLVDEALRRQWFGDGWLQLAETTYERRLDLAGDPVPNTKRDRSSVLNEIEGTGDVRDFDPTAELPLGARVRHPEYGEGVVVHVELVRLGIRYPRIGIVTSARTPPGARPFDPHHRYAQGDVFVHPTYGPGVVVLAVAAATRIWVRFAAGAPIVIANGSR